MLVWSFVAAFFAFIMTVAILRLILLARQAKELQKTIESMRGELTPAAKSLVEELTEIRSRVEEIRGQRGHR